MFIVIILISGYDWVNSSHLSHLMYRTTVQGVSFSLY